MRTSRWVWQWGTLALVAGALAACGDGRPILGGPPDATTDVQDGGGVDALDVADVADAGIDALDVADVADVPDAIDAPDVPVDAGCASNDQCAGNAAGGVCDTATGECVQCLAANDTCTAGTYCVDATHTCEPGCGDDNGCLSAAGDGGVDGGAGPALHCDTATHTCVECVADAQCPPGFVCTGHACAMGCNDTQPCPAGQSCCTGACVDEQTNVAHCGGCDTACSVANGAPACVAGACAVGACTAPFADCDSTADNGCETDTSTSLLHCGDCATACPTPANAAPTCVAGACGFTCLPGFADCNGAAGDGCEVALDSDPMHCGGCSNACDVPNATAACVGGTCAVGACAAGFADCNATPGDGCETGTLTDPSHCGTCDNACVVPNATAACAVGACAVGSCADGFGDCDNMPGNGCETDLTTSLAHCGTCNAACAPANASGACVGGACAVAACAPGFADCNNTPGDGCETSTQTTSNCGGCGIVCPAGAACTAGACQFGGGGTGALNVTGTTTVNTTASPASGTAGTSSVTLTTPTGFAAGQEVLIHQTQGTNAGQYEYHRITSVAAGVATLDGPLAHSYTTNSGNDHAQAVVVAEYTTVTVGATGTLTAPAWNGSTGGILAVDASGAFTVAVGGTVTMSGRGFRGRNHACLYRCARGFQGEGVNGLGGTNIAANANGGGGGGAGQDDASGAGGGYGTAGGAGGVGGCGICAEACPIPGGAGGAAVGTANLSTSVLFGGAGGEGGADEDGSHPGSGGNGGGAIVLRAQSFTLGGSVSADGAAGVGGDSTSCNAVGCGMGGGGSGAGGAVRLVAVTTATIGAGFVHASGSTGGAATCGSARGGAGGSGRVGIRATAVVGTSTPAFDPN